MFELGCFLALIDYLKAAGVESKVEGLQEGEFRYLTSPSGKPDNFSYMTLNRKDQRFELRSQLRVRARFHRDVAFTPDLVLVRGKAKVEQILDSDYAGGKRGVYAVEAKTVEAIYECKSLPGYPELYVSFLGMVAAIRGRLVSRRPQDELFLSTLFVGGQARAFHRRMLAAIDSECCVRVVTGLHKGGWLLGRPPPP